MFRSNKQLVEWHSKRRYSMFTSQHAEMPEQVSVPSPEHKPPTRSPLFVYTVEVALDEDLRKNRESFESACREFNARPVSSESQKSEEHRVLSRHFAGYKNFYSRHDNLSAISQDIELSEKAGRAYYSRFK